MPQGILLGTSVQKGTGPTVGLVSHLLASCGWLVYAKVSEVCQLGAVLGLGISGVSLLCHSSWCFITLCPCVGWTEERFFTSWRSWEQEHTQILTKMLRCESWYTSNSPDRDISRHDYFHLVACSCGSAEDRHTSSPKELTIYENKWQTDEKHPIQLPRWMKYLRECSFPCYLIK